MISKELLSEVLDVEVRVIAGVTSTNELKYNNDSIAQFINIYELAHKCKEWAYIYGIMLQSYPYNDKGRCDIVKWKVFEDEYVVAETEQLAIFSACQWILDNKTN